MLLFNTGYNYGILADFLDSIVLKKKSLYLSLWLILICSEPWRHCNNSWTEFSTYTLSVLDRWKYFIWASIWVMGRWPQIDNLAAIAACLKPKTKEVRQFLGLAEAALKQAVTDDVRIDDGYIK